MNNKIRQKIDVHFYQYSPLSEKGRKVITHDKIGIVQNVAQALGLIWRDDLTGNDVYLISIYTKVWVKTREMRTRPERDTITRLGKIRVVSQKVWCCIYKMYNVLHQ